MIIDRLQIHNFGPFYGDHEMEFDEDGRGVHLIRGGNGQGKTSIQRALIWGLYGRVVDRKGKDIRLTSLLNRRARRDDIYQFWVRIDFTHGGQEWTVIRKTEASVHSDKRYRDGIAVSLVRDGEPLPNPERELERILPYEVHRFFFFDGEMLRDYEELLEQSGRSTALLRNSIEKVLGIPYLRTARDDLYEVEKKFERERNSLVRRLGGRDFDQLVDDYQAISDEIDMRRGHIKELEQQIAELDGEIGDNKRRLADIESVRKLAEERLGIEQQMADLERRRDRETEKISKAVSQLHKTLLAAPAGSVIARLEREHQAVMQKYDRKQRYIGRAEELEEAIAANKCKLCGAVLNERELRRLEADLKEVHIRIKDLTEVPEPNLEFENHVNRLKRMVSEAPAREEFTDIEDRLTEINHEIAAEKARLASILEELKGVDAEEPRRLSVEIEDMSKELGRLQGIKEAEEAQLLDDLEVKAEVNKKIASIDKEEIGILARRILIAKSLAEVLETAIDQYRNERRSNVETVATSIFRDIRTKESFESLSINEQFGLNIMTTDGTVLDRAEWRSAGEEQIVALALVGALNRCANVEAPVFMDTPFGRLDTRHGERVLRFLPNLANQVVLLVTDREFRKGDEQYLEGKIRSDQTVMHRGEEKGSFMVETRAVEVSA